MESGRHGNTGQGHEAGLRMKNYIYIKNGRKVVAPPAPERNEEH